MTEARETGIRTSSDEGFTPVVRPSANSKLDAEYADMPEDLRREAEITSKSRRDFMKVSGMAAMAGVIAGCTAEERIVKPLLNKPEGITPGVHYNYAGTCQGCSANCSALYKVRDGRPIKAEGNPQSPLTGGGLCGVGQAQLWTLYNPERLHEPRSDGENVEWDDLDAAAKKAIAGGGAVLLTGTINGACANDVIRKFTEKTKAKHVSYDAISTYAIAKAHAQTHNAAVIPHYRFDKADVVVSFDADFLGTWMSPVEHARQWSKTRDLKNGKKDMSRLLCFEARMSLTGANADQRWRIKDSERSAVLVDLANRLGGDFGSVPKHAVPEADMAALATELKKSGRRSLIVSGSRAVDEQLLVNWINNKLGAYGGTVDLVNHSRQKLGDDEALAKLLSDMEGGKVKTLIVWGVNPVYDLPNGAKFKEAMGKVSNTIAIASHLDETAAECKLVAAEDDPLESWNDFEPVKGYHSLTQPMLRRLWNTRQGHAGLLAWSDDNAGAKDYRKVLKAFWEANILTGGQTWKWAVEWGVVDRRGEGGSAQPGFDASAVSSVKAKTPADGLEVITYQSYNLGDGKHAGNGWLQEMADPMVRVAWTNLALMSPDTLKEQGLAEGDIIDVKAGDGTCRVPVGRQPGQAEGTVAISLGYGRTHAGKITHGMGTEEDAVDPELLDSDEPVYKIGGNAYPLIGASGASLEKVGREIRLAKISKHDSQEGRPLLKQTSLDQWKKNPIAGNQQDLPPEDLTLWKKWEYKGHKWGMAVDLNLCTGCNACMVACNVENNIPVVGKEEVWRRREMHWIRIDAYYEDNEPADGERTNHPNPEVGFQPMMCQHCENAPCETVCPVIATSHSEEGLNVQTYNRCIGTRYCANNCPYKVRRFNWFMYKWHDLTMNLRLNPDLTVRSQGVMEKCSMCAQRIYGGKRDAALHGAKFEDTNTQTACQQTCPTDAIVFGDENNADSEVSKWKKNPRNYGVLAEINTRPAVTYLTKVRNRPAKESELALEKSVHDGHEH